MSIATDEAEEWAKSKYVGRSHIERHNGHAVSVPDCQQQLNLRIEGYIAGRTAEPTDAEIEAGAEALCEYYEDDELTDDRRKAALLVLYSANEAVA